MLDRKEKEEENRHSLVVETGRGSDRGGGGEAGVSYCDGVGEVSGLYGTIESVFYL